MGTKDSAIWIAWEKHRRTIELCKALGIDLYIFESQLRRPIKYVYLIIKTYHTLLKRRPRTLYIQNPSIILSAISIASKYFFGYKLIVDSHNAGLYPAMPSLKPFSFLYGIIQRFSDLTIVTNSALSAVVKQNRGTPFILPDKIPAFSADIRSRSRKKPYSTDSKISIIYISTFGADEPFEEVINAAGYLSSIATIYVTGDYNKAGRIRNSLPGNMILTGFIPEDQYLCLLHSVDLSIILTTREDCLLCGAYEAVAANVPGILSDTTALRGHFCKGFVFTNNEAISIAESVLSGIKSRERLLQEQSELKDELCDRWHEQLAAFKKLSRNSEM